MTKTSQAVRTMNQCSQCIFWYCCQARKSYCSNLDSKYYDNPTENDFGCGAFVQVKEKQCGKCRYWTQYIANLSGYCTCGGIKKHDVDPRSTCDEWVEKENSNE